MLLCVVVFVVVVVAVIVIVVVVVVVVVLVPIVLVVVVVFVVVLGRGIVVTIGCLWLCSFCVLLAETFESLLILRVLIVVGSAYFA